MIEYPLLRVKNLLQPHVWIPLILLLPHASSRYSVIILGLAEHI